MEGPCVSCDEFTKYVCLKCNVFICNRKIECSIPTSEDYFGWKAGNSVALCTVCDMEEESYLKHSSSTADEEKEEGKEEEEKDDDENEEENIDNEDDDDEGETNSNTTFSVNCSSRGFHMYR